MFSRSTGTILFDIAPTAYAFTLPEMVLSVSWKVTNEDGSNIEPSQNDCAVIDDIGNSMFKSVRFKVNQHWALNVQVIFRDSQTNNQHNSGSLPATCVCQIKTDLLKSFQ